MLSRLWKSSVVEFRPVTSTCQQMDVAVKKSLGSCLEAQKKEVRAELLRVAGLLGFLLLVLALVIYSLSRS